MSPKSPFVQLVKTELVTFLIPVIKHLPIINLRFTLTRLRHGREAWLGTFHLQSVSREMNASAHLIFLFYSSQDHT